MTSAAEHRYLELRKLADLGREVERRRQPDPYPRPTGPAPSLEQLRMHRDEINRMATAHGALRVRIFGSVARGDTGPNRDLDVLVDMDNGPSLFDLAALQGDLEDLLGCPVHVVTTGGLSRTREHTRDRIEHEALPL